MHESVERVRDKVAARFAVTLGPVKGRQLEVALFNHVLRTCERDRVRFLWPGLARERFITRAIGTDVFNLRRNPALVARLATGELGLKRFVAMPPWEVDPGRWEEVFFRAAGRALKTSGRVEDAPDGLVQCSRCRSMKTTYTQMQTRSADEPMTSFFLCLACQKRWKG